MEQGAAETLTVTLGRHPEQQEKHQMLSPAEQENLRSENAAIGSYVQRILRLMPAQSPKQKTS